MKIEIEKIQQFHDFLTGASIPEGVLAKSPKLKPKAAMTVIWFLQEVSRIIPDRFDMCDDCGEMFDSLSEGIHLVTGRRNNICDNCTTDADERRYKKENGE